MHTDLAQKRESMDEYEAAPILYVRDYECLFEQGRVRMC
ncbi:protein of unknown function (plasmid) [Caballeronia sp. S22]|jgi:hypothetical protein